MRRARILPLLMSGLLLCLPLAAQARGHHHSHAAPQQIAVAELPPEGQETMRLIRRGGPYPYARDGVVFGNYEHRLPARPRGYYHEYTVRMPGVEGRGPRRIICGEVPDCYYTADHYRTFSRITGEP